MKTSVKLWVRINSTLKKLKQLRSCLIDLLFLRKFLINVKEVSFSFTQEASVPGGGAGGMDST